MIADEGFWQKGLFGENEDDPVRLCIAGLGRGAGRIIRQRARRRPSARKSPVKDARGPRSCETLLSSLQAALAGEPDGYVTRAALVKGKLPSGSGIYQYIRGLEWARKVHHGLRPGAAADELAAAVKQYGFLSQIKRRVEMWRAIGELMGGREAASGHLVIKTGKPTVQGTVRLPGNHGITADRRASVKLPIIHADATLQLELSQYLFARLELAIDLRLRRRTSDVQVTGEAVGISSLQTSPAGQPEGAGEEKRGCGQAEAAGRDLPGADSRSARLVIYLLAIEDEFKGLNNVEVAHHGAMKRARLLERGRRAVVIGRCCHGRRTWRGWLRRSLASRW